MLNLIVKNIQSTTLEVTLLVNSQVFIPLTSAAEHIV